MHEGLAIVDWAVVGFYLALVVAVGLYFSGRIKSASDFFLAGKTLPWWAAALSIVAAETSAVTYIGTPRLAYQGDWWFLQFVLGLVLGRIVLALLLVRVFYRRDILTVYGIIEHRFGNAARVTAAFLFLLGRVVASGVRLYAGCLAVQVATGFPLSVSVLILGGFSTLYTLAGGIRAVVWTDVLLGLTFMAGGVVSALSIGASLPDGILSGPLLAEKTTILHPGWNLSSSNCLLAGLAGGFVLTLATHGTDQDVVQKILTCRNSRSGSLSILGSAVLILPLMALFLTIGTLLFFFYRTHQVPYELPRQLDHIFPVFIVRELPRGFAGFVMAGLFAAATSSFASVLNALASTTLSDLYKPILAALGRSPSERHFFRFSRSAALFWAVVLLGVALAFQGSSDSVLNVALSVLTYFYGALLGAFLLASLTARGSGPSVVTGMLLSVPAVLLLQLRQFLEMPSLAPDSLRALIVRLPDGFTRAVLDHVPAVAWPWWIIVGTTVTFGVGYLGTRRPAAE